MAESLQHRDITYVGDGQAWVGACVCGWEGTPRPSRGVTGAQVAKADYVKHVEAELGVQAYYEASVCCRNCGSHHRQGVAVGTHVSSAPCQQCGNRMLQPDNDVWDQSREHSKNFGWFR